MIHRKRRSINLNGGINAGETALVTDFEIGA